MNASEIVEYDCRVVEVTLTAWPHTSQVKVEVLSGDGLTSEEQAAILKALKAAGNRIVRTWGPDEEPASD